MEDLKLFVWENVLCGYSCGVMFALAEDVESARQLITNSVYGASMPELYNEEPEVHTAPFGLAMYGGE